MTRSSAACPLCQKCSERIHCRYVRKIADVPWSGVPVKIRLRVRRFFCDNPDCSRRIFVERLSPAIAPYARRTHRLELLLEAFSLALGGEAGAPLAQRSGMPTSPNSLLRLIRRTSLAPVPTPHVLGVDDWAKRKRQSYGTILVDLEKHRPIDLLPDRTPEALAAWLREHPGVEIITRDRSHDYAQGSTQGAPQARQVADRWHLIGNCREVVQRVLERHPAQLRAAARRAAETQPAEPPQVPEPANSLPVEAETHSAQSHQAPQPPSEMETWYAEIKALERQGVSQRVMARRLHLSRTTVRKYLRSSQVPVRHHGPQSRSTVLPYLDYLKQRWVGGVQEYMQLWKELQGQGYRGSYSSVRRALSRFPRSNEPTGSALRPEAIQPLSGRQASWLLVQKPESLPRSRWSARSRRAKPAPMQRSSIRYLSRSGK
ncbi:MAG: ISL3 family transposase [Chloroflexi bacterium]|nr:ISL3 family transposase [Chloroflexota bacterium]